MRGYCLQQGLIAYGNWLFKYRNSIFPFVLLALFAGWRPVLFRNDVAADNWLDLVGVLIAATGQVWRAVVIGYAYIKRGGRNKRVHASRLVTAGCFAHVRNPLYGGNLLILVGLFVIHNNPLVYLLGLGFFGTAYIAIIAAEEAFLTATFGAEYQAYCARVPRWVPRFHGLLGTLQAMQFNWRRVVLKDSSSAYTWLLTAIGLSIYESHAAIGAAPTPLRSELLLSATVLITSAFATVVLLKKRGLLEG